MSAPLVICCVGLVAYSGALAYYCTKIASKKRLLVAQGKRAAVASGAYKASLALCALVEALPLLVPLRPYVVAVVAACGVLGEVMVLRERLDKLECDDTSGRGGT